MGSRMKTLYVPDDFDGLVDDLLQWGVLPPGTRGSQSQVVYFCVKRAHEECRPLLPLRREEKEK
ncbi:MAG: hypothetical protein PHU95_03545 [Candidatus Thermoplasmatota archaeon]|nr:hypothetical protein [Candidatus Thermoplasmatota archaeon]MDD5778502.1 hypothetical protein [Candidatus Thermoplasmatota archaeon]